MKIGFLITARLKSNRLPQKLLLDLNGRMIIERVIDRCKKVVDIADIILCTSSNPQDKPLVDVAKRNDIYYFLGSEEDVLQRLSDAATFFDLDFIISITGENPLFSIYHANLVVNQIKKEKNDFVNIEGLPIGCGVYGLKSKALKVVCRIKKEIDTEIWGPLINRPEIFDVVTIMAHDFYFRSNLRLTNDYFEDFQLMQSVFSHFPVEAIPSLYDALKLLDNNPWYLKISENKVQAGLSSVVLERIDQYYLNNYNEIIETKREIYDL